MIPIKSYPSDSKKSNPGFVDDVILKVNKPAPFSGILVPEENYRYYHEEMKESELIREHLLFCLDNDGPKVTDFILPVLGGIVLGALATMAIQH